MFYISGTARYYRFKYSTVSPDVHWFWRKRNGKQYHFKIKSTYKEGR